MFITFSNQIPYSRPFITFYFQKVFPLFGLDKEFSKDFSTELSTIRWISLRISPKKSDYTLVIRFFIYFINLGYWFLLRKLWLFVFVRYDNTLLPIYLPLYGSRVFFLDFDFPLLFGHPFLQ